MKPCRSSHLQPPRVEMKSTAYSVLFTGRLFDSSAVKYRRRRPCISSYQSQRIEWNAGTSAKVVYVNLHWRKIISRDESEIYPTRQDMVVAAIMREKVLYRGVGPEYDGASLKAHQAHHERLMPNTAKQRPRCLATTKMILLHLPILPAQVSFECT